MSSVQGNVKSNKMNTTKGRFPHNYSSFDKDLSYKKNMLVRFADYTPSFEMEGVPSDDIRLNTKDFIDSLSLNSPFKGTIRKIKESFKVPNMAMLPYNWDLIYTQPAVGGDVPALSNSVFEDFPSTYAQFFVNLCSQISNNLPSSSDNDVTFAAFLTALMRTLVAGEYVYSEGSLLNFCGYKGNAQFRIISTAGVFPEGATYDNWFDLIVYKVFSNIGFFSVTFGGRIKRYRGLAPLYYDDRSEFYGSFRDFLDDFRENPLGTFYLDSTWYNKTGLASDISYLDNTLDVFNENSSSCFTFMLPPANASVWSEGEFTELNPNTLNYQRLIAYQLCCFHFYSNSSIDVVYTAELLRTYVDAFERLVIPPSDTNYNAARYFSLNGVDRPYDFFSGNLFARCSFATASSPSTPYYFGFPSLSSSVSSYPNLNRFALLALLFGFRHSLRYGDYFVGARPRPYAPINTNVSVNSNLVSVIDITQKIQAQRFANAVERTRQKIENYVDALFGNGKPDIDYHNPLFLSRETDVIYGDEVQNTGAAQASDANSRTANMRGGLGQFTFTFRNDDNHPCVYLQIISFDVKRAYTRSVERTFLHIDRYDMFNPDFQYIGDQPVYGIELGMPTSIVGVNPPGISAIFAYQGRDMEYKQRFDVCCGGFEKNLPGWIFTDQDYHNNPNAVIGPEFIRNTNAELDRFYLSLTGYSLGTYFHFICITQNNVYAKRPMAVDPQILG